MAELEFEWDEAKNEANLRKHGVTFEEAATALSDEQGRVIPDPDHSEDEDRFILLGISQRARVLVVCHCLRQNRQVIRIISARKATTNEQGQYGR